MENTSESGQDILDAQCALTRLGFYAGDIDGLFGPETAAGLQRFQIDRKIPATDYVNNETTKMLGIRPPAVPVLALPGITAADVSCVFPTVPPANIDANLVFILNCLQAAGLADCEMISMVLATLRTETSRFLPVSEKQGHCNTTPGGAPYDRYATVLGNTSFADASRFRGRGFIQLTGRSNYALYSRVLFGDDRLVQDPLLAHDRVIAATILVRFMKQHESKLRPALQSQNLAGARRIVNGGGNGLAAFINTYRSCLQLPAIRTFGMHSKSDG